MFVDVKKAHLIPACEEDVYVLLLAQFGQDEVVKLRRWLYGMRKAAHHWEMFYTNKLREIGFKSGMASPVVFYNALTKVRCVVHGDDFTFTGTHSELERIRKWMCSWCEIRFRGIMGSEPNDIKERDILGRRVVWTQGGDGCTKPMTSTGAC